MAHGTINMQEENTYRRIKKMQDVHFNSVHEFLEYLPDKELQIVKKLQALVFECIPGCSEKLSYNVPFYKRNANICFIWPASVTWGKKQTYEGVRFGFTKGYLLADEMHYLSRENRKQVFWRDFEKLTISDLNILRNYLHEAVLIDNMIKEKKKN